MEEETPEQNAPHPEVVSCPLGRTCLAECPGRQTDTGLVGDITDFGGLVIISGARTETAVWCGMEPPPPEVQLRREYRARGYNF